MLLLYSILLILPPTLDKMDFSWRLLLWGSIHFPDGFAASTGGVRAASDEPCWQNG